MKISDGFSMIELLVSISIAAIVLAIGMPEFSTIIKRNRTTVNTNLFVSSVNLARSEAIKRGSPVTLCASTDASSCVESTDWSSGWVLLNDDGNLLQSWSELHDQLTFTGTVASVQFLDSGFQAGSTVSFVLAEEICTGTSARQVIISRIGHARAADSTCPEQA